MSEKDNNDEVKNSFPKDEELQKMEEGIIKNNDLLNGIKLENSNEKNESENKEFDIDDDKKDISKKKKTLNKIIMISTAAAISVVVISVVFFLVHNNSYNNNFNQGVSSYNSGDYDLALNYFKKAEKFTDDNNKVELLEYLAKTYEKKNDFNQALEIYKRILEIDAKNQAAIMGLAQIYKQKRNGIELKELIEKYRNTEEGKYIESYIATAPKFSLTPGTYTKMTYVPIVADQDCAIYYTLDGSEPSEASTIYTKPIKLPNGTTQIKAVAITTYGIKSNVSEATYDVKYTRPNPPVISLDSGTYVSGTDVFITTEEGNEIRYTIDGSTPNANSPIYTSGLKLQSGNIILSAISINKENGLSSGTASKSYVVVKDKKELEALTKKLKDKKEENKKETKPAEKKKTN